jgi:hypothetical protein
MDRITRRNALAAGAALALGACSDEAPEELNEDDDLSKYAPRLAEIAEEKRAVNAWLEEHRGALPSTYEEIVRLPSAYRVPVVAALPTAQAWAVMDEHFRIAGEDAGRTAAQRELIADVRAYLSPAWWAAERVERNGAWIREFGEREMRAFGLADRVRIFESIGPEDEGVRKRILDKTM